MSLSEADKNLQKFNQDPSNLLKLKFFVERSENPYVQYLAASALKNIFSEYWPKIPMLEK